MDTLEKQEEYKGEENTAQDIFYLYRMSTISDFTCFRLILERIDYLENYVNKLETVNNLKV